MAVSNSTETPAVRGFTAFPISVLSMPELEKISCSIKGKTFVHPLELMGVRIRFAETIHSDLDDGFPDVIESHISFGTVLAVSLGSIAHGIKTSLLIQEDGFDPYYSDISDLTVLEVLDFQGSADVSFDA